MPERRRKGSMLRHFLYKKIKILQKIVIHIIQYKLLIKNKNLVTKSFIFVDSVD